jgi:hypothetical protein
MNRVQEPGALPSEFEFEFESDARDRAAAMSVEHDIPRCSGIRVVSFPPYSTAPPLALASPSSCVPPSSAVAALDPNRTHRPTGQTAPPLHLVCERAPSLAGLFGPTVMETLPDLDVNTDLDELDDEVG